jgi:hypothetical protein
VIQNIKEITSEELSDTESSPKFKNFQKAPNSPKSKKKENQPAQPILRKWQKSKTQGEELTKPKEFKYFLFISIDYYRPLPDKRRPLGEKNSSSSMATSQVPQTGSTLEHHEYTKRSGWKCGCNKCK